MEMKKNVYCRFIPILFFCLLPVVSVADTEPNNSFETASPLVIGILTTGSVNGISDPVDWYKVIVPEDGELTITVTHDPSPFQFILYGRDEDFDIIGTETNAPSGRQLIRSVQRGTYHIQVNSRYNASPVGYSIRVTLDAAPPVTSDADTNDTPAQAGPISLNVEETGHISHTRDDGSIDDLDYYWIDLGADAEVSITFTHDPPDFSFLFRLLGYDGTTQIFGTETNFRSGDTRTRSLAAGRYCLLVEGRGVTHGRTYRFTVETDTRPAVTADKEPNDSVEGASTLFLNTSHIGHISHTRDDGVVDNLDYYRFELSAETEVSFTFSHDPSGHPFQFRILAADGQTHIFGTETNFPSGDTRTRTLTAGTYFLEVNGRGSVQGRTYSFFVGTDQGENEAPLSVSPTRASIDIGDTKTFTISGGISPYTAVSDDTSIAFVSLSGDTVEVTGMAEGSTTVTITDSDSIRVNVDIMVKETTSSGACATFNLFTNTLRVPCLDLGSGITYRLDLQLIAGNPTLFQLVDFGENLADQNRINGACATFNLFTNTLRVPCLDLGSDVTYWLDLELVPGDPIAFQISEYGENSP